MSIIKLNNALNKINNKKSMIREVCTSANINISEGIIELKTNGVPSIISISYSGTALFSSLIPIYFKVKTGKNKIIINNLFRKNIPENILSYQGNISITHCIIISCDSSKLSANITNSQNLALLNKSETNLEDDSLVLFEETPHVKQKLNISGIKGKIIPPSSFSPDGKLQKYGKKEVEEISSIITEIAPSISFSKEDRDRIIKRPVILKESYRQQIDKLGGKTPDGDKIRYGDVQGNFKKYRK